MTEPVIDPGTAITPPAPAAAPAASAGATVASHGLKSAARARWLAAGSVVAATVVVVAGAVILLGSRPVPEALTYVPADSAVVAELRMDLPGDQLQKVGNLLAHFPGFKDQTTLSQKIDETLSRITRDASKGSIDYATRIKPWIAGPLFAGVFPPNSLAPTGDRPAVIVATTDGTASCAAVFTSGAPTVTEVVEGVTVTSSKDGTFACAISGRFGLLGQPGMVEGAITDHAGHKGMDANSQYRTARDRLGGDRLATFYVSKAAIHGAEVLSSDVPLASAGLGAALDRIPDWAIAGVNAEDDALVADLVTAPLPPATDAAGSPLPTMAPAHKSRVAPLLPADTMALIDIHGAGAAVHVGLARLGADPSLAPALSQAQAALQALGGVDAIVGWIDDAGIAVVPDGTTATGGVILVAADDTTASAKATQIKSLLALAAIGGGIDVHQTQIAGIDVTVVDISNLGNLVQGVPGASSLLIPTGQHVVLAFAAKGPAILAGGEAFVRRSLETQAGASLVDAPGYVRALGRAAAENIGEVYVGAAPALAFGETLIPASPRASFDANAKPYVEPFDALLITTTLDRDGAHVRLVASVK
jgi:hypothetical protein